MHISNLNKLTKILRICYKVHQHVSLDLINSQNAMCIYLYRENKTTFQPH